MTDFREWFERVGLEPVELDGAEHERRALEAEEDLRQDRVRRLQRAGAEDVLPAEDFRAIVQGTLGSTATLEATRRWINDERPILMLLSPVGRGKTLAACWAISEIGGLFRTASAVLKAYSGRGYRAFAEQSETEESRLLVIDDVGMNSGGSEFGETLAELVNVRRSPRRRTIITSNYSPRDFAKRYDNKRLHSRLHQSAVVIADIGEDLRRAKK